MPGTRAGGLKAAAKNMATDPRFYAKIGAKGGRNGHTGGFASDVDCYCPLIIGRHYVRNCAGLKGGTISRRGVIKRETV